MSWRRRSPSWPLGVEVAAECFLHALRLPLGVGAELDVEVFHQCLLDVAQARLFGQAVRAGHGAVADEPGFVGEVALLGRVQGAEAGDGFGPQVA